MGIMLRPKAVVLPDSAVVPAANQKPPPARLTHEVVTDQPYYYSRARIGMAPDGHFVAGTKVQLLARGKEPMCRVVDRQGLCVIVAYEGLRPLRSS